jgi:hypothetical protein
METHPNSYFITAQHSYEAIATQMNCIRHLNQTKLRGLKPREGYMDQAASVCRRS